MEDIENRDDVIQMVNSFYDLVRVDKRLGFLFDETAKVNWPEHLPRMYDFWESILFDKALFSGNPLQKHQKLHSMQALKPEDFEIWLTGLPENIRNDMKIKGFELCKGVLSFTRYIMEKNDIGMEEWLKNNLTKEDYNEYCKSTL